MATSFGLIQDLVGWVGKYNEKRQNDDFSIEDFLVWMNKQIFQQKLDKNTELDENEINMELSFLLIMQNRHYKAYSKHALADSELSSPDSFSYLYHLSLVDSYRKMELVKMHQMEAPSGIEVLKRLLSKKYIEEYDDPNDKRAKRIMLTHLGRTELDRCLPLMNAVFKQMAGNMTRSEKLHFIAALREISDFHQENDMHHPIL